LEAGSIALRFRATALSSLDQGSANFNCELALAGELT
jgi:hypothetical protein